MKKLLNFELHAILARLQTLTCEEISINKEDLCSIVNELLDYREVKQSEKGRYTEHVVRVRPGENPAEFLIRVISECEPHDKE